MVNRNTEGIASRTGDMLSVVLDRSDQCVMLLAPDDAFVYINPAGRAHLGIAETAELTLSDWLDRWPGESRLGIKGAVANARTGRSSRVEASYPEASGALRWCGIEATPVSDPADGTPHILLFAHDTTALVNERLAEQSRRLAAERELELLDGIAREMRHRFKNQLAVISSLLRLSARHSDTVAELTTSFEQRLAALSRAQDFMGIHRGGDMDAGEALQQILRASGAGERISVTRWPDVMLGDDAVQQLALILGELQTNALKYGALTTDEGRITLSAALEEGRLALLWLEEGGEQISPPKEPGGGLKLLERMGSLPGAKAATEWRTDGVAIRFYVKANS